MARAIRRKSSNITPRKKGVSHGIKKPKVKTTVTTKKKVASALISTAASVPSSTAPSALSSKRVVLSSIGNCPTKRQSRARNIDMNEIQSDDDDEDNDDERDGNYESESEDESKIKKKKQKKTKQEIVNIEHTQLSEFEKIRLKNIQKMQTMMSGILESKTKLSAAFSPAASKKSAASKRGLLTDPKPKEVLPPRKSSRLSGGKVAEISRYVPEPVAEKEILTLPLKTLEIQDTLKNGDDESELKSAKEFLENISFNLKSESDIERMNGLEEKEKGEYEARFEKMTINQERVVKIVPDRIFSMAIHPSSHKVVVSAGGKYGGVGLWDVADTSSKEHGVYLFTPHTRPVNCMSWDRYNSNQLVTTSYDGTTRVLDTEKMQHRLVYGDKDFIEDGGYMTAHSQIDAFTYLVAKGGTGCVGLVDTRTGFDKTVQEYRIFNPRTSPKCIDVHPVRSNIFMSANAKAGCFIYDSRNQGKKFLMDPVCELTGHSKSISSALFSPITGNKVLTVSYDDKLRLFDTSKLEGELRGKETRHNNQTGRWLTPFKARWHPRYEDLVFTGSMNRPREMEAWQADSTLSRIFSFKGEELLSICSILDFHPTLDVLVGGNSSGRVHAFIS